MIRDKNNAMLAGFYKTVATLIRKNGKATLAEIEERNPKHKDAAFSWMQWPEAKQWFSIGGAPMEYRLRTHLEQTAPAELLQMINDYYDEPTKKAR